MSEKVSVAIPTYNASEHIESIVGDLLPQGFNKVIICDDKSQDDTAERIRAAFGDSVIFIAGDENIGAGPNRNRVLSVIEDDELILFIDVDMELLVKDGLPELVRQALADESVGSVGFSILAKNGSPMGWNFGEQMHPVREAAWFQVEKLYRDGVLNREQFMQYAPELAASYRMTDEAEPRETGWVSEACFAMPARLFKQLGGFAMTMRYHADQDLNARVQEAGYETMFDPRHVVRHLEIDVRGENRWPEEREARLEYFRRRWGMGEQTFRKLFREE